MRLQNYSDLIRIKVRLKKGNKMNISSIVVQVLPKNYDEVKEALEGSGVCDYTLETKKRVR